MSRPVHERLRELENEVRDLPVLPAADVRARGRRRGRRQLAAVTGAGAVVAVTVSVAFAWPQQRAVEPSASPDGRANVGDAGVACDLTLPDSPADVRIRVLDGGAAAGLADETATQLRARTFTVLGATNGAGTAGAAELRYGPGAIGAATFLRAALHDEATMRFDPDRRDETVDLTLGPAFTRLASTTELNEKLVSVGVPSAPVPCQ